MSVTTCPKCGRPNDKPKACEKCLAIEWQRKCPPLYQRTEQARIPNQRALAEVLAWKYSDKGLLLDGATGQGKTRSMMLLMQRMHNDHRDVGLYDCREFEHECSVKFAHVEIGVPWIRELAEQELLFIDDIDKFKFTPRVETELFGLIERRIANELPTMITLNQGADKLCQRLQIVGEPLVRRLLEFSQVVSF